jgi:hypothetical protein
MKMGQYHKAVNLDKKEYIHGHDIDCGLKLLEQVGFRGSTADALFLLMACSNGRGGGDVAIHPVIGRWAGDRVAVIGDYAVSDDVPGIDAEKVYSDLGDKYLNISEMVLEMICHSLSGD